MGLRWVYFGVLVAVCGCIGGTCDTAFPPAEEAQLTSAEWDSISRASGTLKSAKALDMCAEKFGDGAPGKWGYAESCGERCLACYWTPACKY